MAKMGSAGNPGAGWMWASLGVAAGLFATAFLRTVPPAPVPANAPPTLFSAERAGITLRALAVQPRPIGSAAHATALARVVEAFRDAGYAPETQDTYVCSEYGVCAPVSNVIARLPGRIADSWVALLAHYDSVAAGPGAADDAAGVAVVIEVARALRGLGTGRNGVLFLADDGEEPGLLGAAAFLSQHPLARQVRAVVNIEAGGISGPSLLLESGFDDRDLILRFNRRAARPFANSLLPLLYRSSGHDTDFSLFRDKGIDGFNFAFTSGGGAYHTALDRSDAVSLRSLQQQGDNALAAVLAATEISFPAAVQTSDYFDLLGTSVIVWPRRYTDTAASVCAALLLLFLVAGLVRRRFGIGGVAAGLVAMLLAAIFSAGTGAALQYGFRRIGALSTDQVAHPIPLALAFAALGLSISAFAAALLLSTGKQWAGWYGVWIGWAAIAVACRWLAPEATYLVLVPVAAALPSAVLSHAATRPAHGFVVPLQWLPAAAGAIIWLPILLLLDAAVGARAQALWTVVVSAIFLPLLVSVAPGLRGPLLRLGGIGLAVFAPCLVLWLALPLHSASAPAHLTMTFHQDGSTGKARWLVRYDTDDAPRLAGDLARSRPVKAFPWSRPWEHEAALDAAHSNILAPVIDVIDDRRDGQNRRVTILARSQRQARDISLYIPGSVDLHAVTVAGVEVPGVSQDNLHWFGGWWTYRFLGVPPEGVRLQLTWSAPAPFELYVIDRTGGIPDEEGGNRISRPDNSVAMQDGDGTIVSRKYQF